MKRYMVAAGVGSLVFAAAVGSASMLGINPGVAQTGIETLGGDTDGVKVTSYISEGDTGESHGLKVARINDVPQGSELFAVAPTTGTATWSASANTDVPGWPPGQLQLGRSGADREHQVDPAHLRVQRLIVRAPSDA